MKPEEGGRVCPQLPLQAWEDRVIDVCNVTLQTKH